jgi:hypothetical protein
LDNIERSLMIFDVIKAKENARVTYYKTINKAIFNKAWLDDMISLREDHQEQMALLFCYGDKVQFSSD